MDSSLNNAIKIDDIQSYVDENLDLFSKVLNSLESVSGEAKSYLVEKTSKDGRIDNSLLEKYQYEGHGFAWFETYRISLRETLNWYKRLKNINKSSKLESGILIFAFSEYLTQMRNGIMMSQTEVVRPSILGISHESFSFYESPDVANLIKIGSSDSVKDEIVSSLENGIFPNLGLNDELFVPPGNIKDFNGDNLVFILSISFSNIFIPSFKDFAFLFLSGIHKSAPISKR